MASPFIESEWIGQGKEYDIAKIPEHVTEAKKQLLKIPDAVEAMIPHNTMLLRDFLGCKLPTKSSEFIPINDTSLFSKKPPCGVNHDAETLTKRAIPSDQHLQILENQLGQAWFDGNKSIVDWRYGDGDALVFWMLSYWRRMSWVVQQKEKWQRGVRFLDFLDAKANDDNTKLLLNEVTFVINRIGWHIELPYLQGTTSTLDLVTFLGSGWMNSDHMDMMIEALSHRLPSDSKVVLAPLILAQNIYNFVHGKRESRLLKRYVNGVKEGKIQQIYFPVHVHDQHWIAAYIDFEKKCFGVGEFFYLCRDVLVCTYRCVIHRQETRYHIFLGHPHCS